MVATGAAIMKKSSARQGGFTPGSWAFIFACSSFYGQIKLFFHMRLLGGFTAYAMRKTA